MLPSQINQQHPTTIAQHHQCPSTLPIMNMMSLTLVFAPLHTIYAECTVR